MQGFVEQCCHFLGEDSILRIHATQNLCAAPYCASPARGEISPTRSNDARSPLLPVWRLCTTILILIEMAVAAPAQTQFTRIYGSLDGDVPVPQFAPLTGQQDATALQVLSKFVQATGATGWSGLQAQATLADQGAQEATPDSAILTLGEDNEFRMDISGPDGQRSIRINGEVGTAQDSSGSLHQLPLLTARAGLFLFPRLLSLRVSATGATILDRGMTTVGGQNLHRITIEQIPLSVIRPDQNTIPVVDLYFDPTTNLLTKSAIAAQISWTDPERYLQVVTYSSYQPVSGVLVPFTYSVTLNGQPLWTLTLSSVTLGTSESASYFQF